MNNSYAYKFGKLEYLKLNYIVSSSVGTRSQQSVTLQTRDNKTWH